MYVFELSQDLWNNSNQEVNSFSICKSRYEYNIDLIGIARFFDIFLPNGWVRSEFFGVYSIWNSKGLPWIKFSSENEIIFAGMTNANSSV